MHRTRITGRHKSLFYLLLICSTATGFAETNVLYGHFSNGNLNSWESIEFEGQTHYQLKIENGTSSLHAKSKNSASGLIKKFPVDLAKTPFINWSWKVKQALPELPETKKQGDDYAARIYIIFKDGWFFWQTKALNYIWSSRAAPEHSWPNAFAPDNALMIPLRNRDSSLNTWHFEKRNIREDIKNWLGKDVKAIQAVAIMTDTDNSQNIAETVYGDLFFSQD